MPLVPTAWTIAAPGVVATPDRRVVVLPAFGLGTTDHAVQSQCSVRVWNVAVPGISSLPTAHASVGLLAPTEARTAALCGCLV